VIALGLAVWSALGAEPASAEEVEAAPDEVIIVYGEERVKEAREKVIHDLGSLGFTRLLEKDGRLVMRHEQNWRGKAVLYDDGRLDFKRQTPQGTMPDTFFKDASPLIGWVPCVVVPTACVKVGGWVVSPRKLGTIQERATTAVQPSLRELSERQADLAIDHKLDDLEAQLIACWEQGVPLEGSEPLPTPEARRAHLLDYWRTRTDTVWGERMRQPVESFLRNVVQASDHPVTTEELARTNANREGLRQLELPPPGE
jgi:hypothetical protein